jgi:hypothetical protein
MLRGSFGKGCVYGIGTAIRLTELTRLYKESVREGMKPDSELLAEIRYRLVARSTKWGVVLIQIEVRDTLFA